MAPVAGFEPAAFGLTVRPHHLDGPTGLNLYLVDTLGIEPRMPSGTVLQTAHDPYVSMCPSDKDLGFGAGAGGYHNSNTKTIGFIPGAYLSRFVSPSFDLIFSPPSKGNE